MAELDVFRDLLLQEGVRATGFQLVKRRNEKRQDLIVFRVETEAERQFVLDALLRVLQSNPHMRYLLDDGELPKPELEIFRKGQLLNGRFKLPVFADESQG